MTKSQAGSIGGKATAAKYGNAYMHDLAVRAANAMHEKYKLVPYGTSDFVFVNRDTGIPTGKTLSGRAL
jgi:hypothetical protein